MVNPVVNYLDITINGKHLSHISFELFVDRVTKTIENLGTLGIGEIGFDYKSSCSHRIISKFICQGGDFTHHISIGNKFMHGKKFDDENFIQSIQVLASCLYRCLYPTQWFPGFHLNCQGWVVWWQVCSFWQVERTWIFWKPWNTLSPGWLDQQEDNDSQEWIILLITIPSVAQESTTLFSSGHSCLWLWNKNKLEISISKF